MEKYYEYKFTHPYNKTYDRLIEVFRKDGILQWGLTQGKTSIIDEEDFNLIVPMVWRAQKSGLGYYALSGRNEDVTAMHTVIGGERKYQVDHKNRNGLDNRRSNLRFSTIEQNMFNRILTREYESCSYRGVQLRKDRDLFRVVVRRLGDNRSSNLCHTKCPVRAAELWDEFMFEEYKNDFPLLGYESNGLVGEPTINFIQFNFPERLGL